MRHGLDALFQRFVKLAQRSLGFALLRNVGIGSKPTDNIASIVPDWLSTGKKPAVVAVFTAKGKSVLPRLVDFAAFTNVSDNAFNMIGMMQFLPAEALHLLERGP